jgi:hypothetical protein
MGTMMSSILAQNPLANKPHAISIDVEGVVHHRIVCVPRGSHVRVEFEPKMPVVIDNVQFSSSAVGKYRVHRVDQFGTIEILANLFTTKHNLNCAYLFRFGVYSQGHRFAFEVENTDMQAADMYVSFLVSEPDFTTFGRRGY